MVDTNTTPTPTPAYYQEVGLSGRVYTETECHLVGPYLAGDPAREVAIRLPGGGELAVLRHHVHLSKPAGWTR